MSKTFIVVDLEATCWDKADTNKPPGFRNEIIEIGEVKCNEAGDVIDDFCMFAKPKKHPIISEFCTTLTTIRQEDIDNAENAEIVLPIFFRWALGMHHENKDAVKFVSWGHYDKRQFRDDLQSNKMDPEVINDSNHLSLKHLHGEWNKLHKPIGLGGACKYEKILFTGTAHRGYRRCQKHRQDIQEIHKQILRN